MWLVGTLLFFGFAVLAHAGLSRVQLPLNVVLRLLIVGGIIGVGLAWGLLENYGIAAPQTWAGLLIYGFCCELYVFLFTLAMSSVSANLLVNLLQRKMTSSDIERLYDSRQMVEARLDRLIGAGLLAETSNRLRPTPKGVRMVRIFSRLRAFFRHLPSTISSPANG